MVSLHPRAFAARILGFALTLLLLAAPISPASAAEGKLTIFAAASLKNALDAVNAAYRRTHGTEIAVSYAASGALAKQIENGAPADVFISADLDWMGYLAEKNLLKPASQRNLLGNSLVLVAAKQSAHPVTINAKLDLAALLGEGRLAIGDPKTVPAGKYAEAALRSLNLWGEVEMRLAPAESVRAALALVSRGEAPYGIVYRTDASADENVEIVGSFPPQSHPPIVYPAAAISASQAPEAADYLDYLASKDAKMIFEAEGFSVLP